jgi:hypothetical protein
LSTATTEKFRRNKRDFSRAGPLSPDVLVTFLLFMVADTNRRGYRHLIDAFWDEAHSFGLALPCDEPISAPALCKARQKLTPELLRNLLHQASDSFNQQFGADKRWFGRRVFAVDGSKVAVQRSADLEQSFGIPPNGHCPQVLVSTLFDLVAKVPHDISVVPFASSERMQLLGMLNRLKVGDVLVLDRGYPSFEMMRILIDEGIDFVMRVPIKNSFAAIQKLIYSGRHDCRARIKPHRNSGMIGHAPVDVRLLRVLVPNAEPTILITTLRRAEFTRSQIAELYHMRWEVEEFYKLMKSNYLGQGQFHARSASGVEQEIHAVALYVAITRYLMAAAAKESNVPYEDLSPKSGALGLAAYVLRLLLACDANQAAPFLDQVLRRIIKTKDSKRPGRRWPRRSFKPCRRWDVRGRAKG